MSKKANQLKYDPDTGEALYRYGKKYYTKEKLYEQIHAEAVLARVEKRKKDGIS